MVATVDAEAAPAQTETTGQDAEPDDDPQQQQMKDRTAIVINHKQEQTQSINQFLSNLSSASAGSSSVVTETVSTTVEAARATTPLHNSLQELSRSDNLSAAARPATAPLTPGGNQPALPAEALHATQRNIQWMLEQGVSRATMQLHPAELGSVKINLSVQDEQLTVQINASQSTTREALDSTLPRLREQLTQQGFVDVNIDLGDQTTGQQFAEQESSGSFQQQTTQTNVATANEPSGPTHTARGNSLIDMFA